MAKPAKKSLSFQNMRFIEHSFFLVPVLFSVNLAAHPFDQTRAESSSYFTIHEKAVELKLKFPVHAYINLFVNSPEEYDRYALTITTEREQAKIQAYVMKHVLAFDGKTNLPLKITTLEFEKDPYLSDPTPSFVVIRGVFTAQKPIREIYLFNKLFEEGKVPHYGDSEIEIGENVFDFLFQKGRYFRYKVRGK